MISAPESNSSCESPQSSQQCAKLKATVFSNHLRIFSLRLVDNTFIPHPAQNVNCFLRPFRSHNRDPSLPLAGTRLAISPPFLWSPSNHHLPHALQRYNITRASLGLTSPSRPPGPKSPTPRAPTSTPEKILKFLGIRSLRSSHALPRARRKPNRVARG